MNPDYDEELSETFEPRLYLCSLLLKRYIDLLLTSYVGIQLLLEMLI